MTKTIIAAKQLHQILNDPDLIILDASQKSNKSGLKSDFEGMQIKGARHFDIKNKFSDTSSAYPNTLPSPAQFEMACRDLGICKSSRIVVYDKLGIYTSPRVWWMFKTMGHDNIAVLDGGLPDWVAQGYETEASGDKEFEAGDFEAHFQAGSVKDFDFVEKNIGRQEVLLVDARSAGRFDGSTPEPRAGLRGGNIPNSINIPFKNLLNNGKFKYKNDLIKIFKETEIKKRPLVFTCGSGITACIVLLASELVLENKTAVFDGSWTEWAMKTS